MTTKKTHPGVGDVDFGLELEQRVQQAISPEAREAFRELQADAPPGEGPIVRRAKGLLTPAPPREAEESDRKVHIPRAELHTHPLPAPAPADTVLRKPRVDHEAVTLPGSRKVDALAPLALETGGRSVAGTVRLAAMPKAPDGLSAAAAEEPSAEGSDAPAKKWLSLPLILAILAALAAVVAMVVWFADQVTTIEQKSTAQVAPPARTATAAVTATATATGLAMPSETASVASTVEPTAKVSATSEPETSGTSRASAQKSGAASARPSVSTVPSVPQTSPTASSSGKWIPI